MEQIWEHRRSIADDFFRALIHAEQCEDAPLS